MGRSVMSARIWEIERPPLSWYCDWISTSYVGGLSAMGDNGGLDRAVVGWWGGGYIWGSGGDRWRKAAVIGLAWETSINFGGGLPPPHSFVAIL